MEFKAVKIDVPEGCNVILGQTHFIKSVEDLYEIIITSVSQARFGIAFSEASGSCLVRTEGNDPSLIDTAARNVLDVASGHFFCIILKDAYPINILNAIKMCQEVCSIYCATANPVEVAVIETEQGRGVIGVVDGFKPKGIEGEEDKKHRKEFLRKIGYKR
ncbi:MAG: adenosine-specific kinase [Nitrospirota bacterium]